LLSTNIDPVLMVPGGNRSYASIKLTPLPSSSTPSRELITFNASVPDGISLKFASNPVDVSSGSAGATVVLTIVVMQTVGPGNYTVNLQGKSGSILEKYTLTVMVVKYLVYMTSNTFDSGTLTVKVGSTVFWMNLDGGSGGDPQIHNVIFSTGTKAASGDLHQYDSFSYTFTSAGSYSYFCSYHPPGMKGTIVVSP